MASKPAEKFNVASCSDSYDDNMAGMAVNTYKGKNEAYVKGYGTIKRGDIIIKKTSEIEHIQSNRGQVHGKLYKWVFGADPVGCSDVDGYGFAIKDGTWRFRSITLKEDDRVPDEISKKIKQSCENYWKKR